MFTADETSQFCSAQKEMNEPKYTAEGLSVCL